MEELNTALATLIEQATTGIDASVSFLQAELPDVIYQLLLWHGVKSAVICFFGVLILITYAVGCRIYWKLGFTGPNATTDLFFFFFPCAMGACLALSVSAAFINLTWLQIWIAPKVWLLEYAANLVK